MRFNKTLLTLVALSGSTINAFLAAPGNNYLSTRTMPSSPTIATAAPLFAGSSNSDDDAATICPLLDPPLQPEATLEAAIGWFWGPQRDYDHVDVQGILETVVGYTGSQDTTNNKNPTYRSIQDYAEAIRITFDPNEQTYKKLLDMLFAFATPSDPRFAGTQYRSAIFYHTLEQKELAEAAVEARGRLGSWVSIEPASDFYRAEEYHQKYIDKQTMSMYI